MGCWEGLISGGGAELVLVSAFGAGAGAAFAAGWGTEAGGL